jgi:GntR family histidine utilization transcriptional repressor
VLAEQFGCARMTVGRAIAALVDAGLLVRRRRAGTFVATPRVEETVLEIHDIQAEVRAAGYRYDFANLQRRRRTAGAKDAQRLMVDVGAPVLAVNGVHKSNGKPIALEERLISLEAVPQARDQPFTETAPGSWLLVEAPWTEAEHQIEAINADAATAALLDLKPGAACLRVDRRTWRGESSITWVRLTFPGDQHRLTGRFRAQAVVRGFPR